MRALSLCLPVLLLTACADQPAAESPAMSSTPSTCNAEAASGLVGQPATPTNVEAARIAAGATSVRALGPTDPMTMDYRIDRLNVIKDAAGAIVQVRCG